MELLVLVYVLTCIFPATNAQIPGPVQNLVIDNIQQWGFTANWDPPATGNVPVAYDVTITNTNTGDIYERSLSPVADGSYEIDHLYDDTTYDFSVMAVNAGGEKGAASERNNIAVPACELCFDTRPTSTTGATFLRLIFPVAGRSTITTQSLDSPSPHFGSQRSISDTSTSLFAFGLQGGVLYQVERHATNSGDLIHASRLRTDPHPVTNLQLNPLSSTSVEVSYEQPVGTAGHKFDGYIITWGDEDLIVGRETTTITVDGLLPGLQYTISVQTFSGELADLTFSSSVSDVITLASGPEASFYVFSKDTDSIIIKFAVIGTSSTATAMPEGQSTPPVNGVRSNGQFTFSGLTPGQVYRIVLTITRVGQASVSTSQSVQTLPLTPTSVVAVPSMTSPTITVSWQPVSGIVSHYRVSFVPSAGLGDDEASLFIAVNLETSYTFDVEPDTAYNITVTALARLRDLESESAPETLVVRSDPRIFTISGLTPNGFSVSFDAVDGAIIYEFTDGMSETIQLARASYTPIPLYQAGTFVQVTVTALHATDGIITVGSQDILLAPLPVTSFTLSSTADTITINNIVLPDTLVDIIAIEYSQSGMMLEGIDYILPSVSEKKIEFLQPSTSYSVSLFTEVYAGGLSQRSSPQTNSRTTSSVSTGVPIVDEITTNAITISWLPQAPYDPRIYILEKDSEVILDDMMYTDSTTTHTFTVQPGTLYQVTIELIGTDGTTIFRTSSKDVRSLPEALTYAQITSVAQTSTVIAWDIPAGASPDGFDIRVIPPPSPGSYPINVPSNTRSYEILNLRPDTIYDISIVSLSGQVDNCQTSSSPFQIFTITDRLGIFEIVAVDVYDSRASFEFSPSEFDVASYEITATPASGDPKTVTVQDGTYMADITDLRGGTDYDVELVAISNANERYNTTSTTFRTLPKSPVSLTDVTTGFFSFTVELVPPVNSSYDGFVVTANGESKTIPQSGPYRVMFDNLVPDETYSVDAYTTLDGLNSQILNDFNPISITTGTAPPETTTIFSTGQTPVTLASSTAEPETTNSIPYTSESPPNTMTDGATEPPSTPSNTFLYVGIAAGVIVTLFIVLAVYVIKLRLKLRDTPTHPPLPVRPQSEIHLNHAYMDAEVHPSDPYVDLQPDVQTSHPYTGLRPNHPYEEIAERPYAEITDRPYEKAIVQT